jgi:hypothetical protein
MSSNDDRWLLERLEESLQRSEECLLRSKEILPRLKEPLPRLDFGSPDRYGPGEVSLSQLQSEIGATARHPTTVMDLNLGVSDPPTAFEVQMIAHKVDELLAALRRP